MCGIIGIVSKEKISKSDLWTITKDAERRGVDSSGILFNSDKDIYLKRSNKSLTKLIKASNFNKTNFIVFTIITDIIFVKSYEWHSFW